jgi:retinol dehydrogenase 14
MKDKICIVTGGNSGIGKATVAGLAQRGATVVIACRDARKGKSALEEVSAKTGSNDLHVMQLDLASLESVRAFAVAFAAKFSHLDVLVANAGVMTAKRQITADGLEMNFGVNHVGHFLLTALLLPLLKASAPSRIVVVSSNLHPSGKLDFDDLAMEKGWSGSYPRSKLANMLFVRALAKRLEGTGVVVNALPRRDRHRARAGLRRADPADCEVVLQVARTWSTHFALPRDRARGGRCLGALLREREAKTGGPSGAR